MNGNPSSEGFLAVSVHSVENAPLSMRAVQALLFGPNEGSISPSAVLRSRTHQLVRRADGVDVAVRSRAAHTKLQRWIYV